MPPVVLCIDSRDANLRAETFMLERAGYEVVATATIEQAAEALQRHWVDLVLVSDDIATDDHAICAQVRRLAPFARIILQRASFNKPSAPPEADIVLPKTISPQEKLNILVRLLSRRAA